MTSEPALRSIEETLVLLEERAHAQQAAGEALQREVQQIRNQIQSLTDQGDETSRATRQVEAALALQQGFPQKITDLTQDLEHLRTNLTETRTTVATNERTYNAEAVVLSRELREALRQIERIDARVELLANEGAAREASIEQILQTLGTLAEEQRSALQRLEELSLRVERLAEVGEEVEGRVITAVQTLQERPMDVVHERLQILAEMAHRAEEAIEALQKNEQVGLDVQEEIGRRRDEQARIEAQVSSLEGEFENLRRLIEQVREETATIEGRHSGLSNRVSTIRRDISEMVDHIREEFTRFNEIQERARQRQIEALEQEQRETKFHALRPPEEP